MASVLANRQYNLDFFINLELNHSYTELDDETIQKINKLSKRVGAPSYQKTPVFKRNNYRHQKPIKKGEITEEDWNSIRNFKKTKLIKNTEGLEAQMDKIRCSLNKLTISTYDIVLDDIVCIIKDIIKDDTNSESSLEKIGEAIFEIGSVHKFWSKVYATLYKELIEQFPVMKDICLKNFKNFKCIFSNINYVDSSVDYDLFCEYNKENEKRRALSSFFSICAELEIISKKEIETIILDFIEQIKLDINKENKANQIAELVENISIMITSGKKYLCEFDNWDDILSSIEYFANLNQKKYPSLTSKMVFKFMDLNDELEED
tara:strand:+ start:7503 stop:8462 length:960 start_codon:yes stop_codon:yes gene_type:complete